MSAPAPLPLSSLPADLPMPQSGRFIADVHYYPVRVYFEDTDAGSVVYHANYLRLMERARSDMLRLLGIDQRAALDGGEGVYAVTNVTIDYRRPARLDDALVIESRVVNIRASRCVIDQIVRRADIVLTQARVTVAFLSPDGRPRRQPAHWVELFQRLSSGEDIQG